MNDIRNRRHNASFIHIRNHRISKVLRIKAYSSVISVALASNRVCSSVVIMKYFLFRQCSEQQILNNEFQRMTLQLDSLFHFTKQDDATAAVEQTHRGAFCNLALVR